ncbi:MAG TPA: helix-turn-helix transcriptional regulator [Pyrinomonadaceae bacterium]|nr:helix-turn-helix transcriptional regulator [Pyrinomonadaceae bacterium]
MSINKRQPDMNFQDFVQTIKRSEAYDKEVARAEISDQISRLMALQKISRAQLASRLGKSRAYVTKILQGNANFTIDSLVQIGRALGCRYTPVLLPNTLWERVEAIKLSSTAEGLPGGVTYPAEHYDPIESGD